MVPVCRLWCLDKLYSCTYSVIVKEFFFTVHFGGIVLKEAATTTIMIGNLHTVWSTNTDEAVCVHPNVDYVCTVHSGWLCAAHCYCVYRSSHEVTLIYLLPVIMFIMYHLSCILPLISDALPPCYLQTDAHTHTHISITTYLCLKYKEAP